MKNWMMVGLGMGRHAVAGRHTIKSVIGVLLATAVLSVNGCAVGEDSVGLSGRPYNYDDRAIISVRVNGRGVGGGMDAAPRGSVKGGAQTCCFRLPRGADTADIAIQYANGEIIETTASIEQPWPPMTSLGIIHVLPGDGEPQVIIEITPGQGFARRDLMDSALAKTGLEREIEYQGPLREGPIEYLGD